MNALEGIALLIGAKITGTGGVFHGALHGFNAKIASGKSEGFDLKRNRQHEQFLSCKLWGVLLLKQTKHIGHHVFFNPWKHRAHMIGGELMHHALRAFAKLCELNGASRGIARSSHMKHYGGDGQNALVAHRNRHLDHFATVHFCTTKRIIHRDTFIRHLDTGIGKNPCNGNHERKEQIHTVIE